ncbi:MAG: hypothetical protein O3C21_08575 [Verrucomicrobia bacterium]|nr:hypothetical protein [Verrucomicrobiota bacterium]
MTFSRQQHVERTVLDALATADGKPDMVALIAKGVAVLPHE